MIVNFQRLYTRNRAVGGVDGSSNGLKVWLNAVIISRQKLKTAAKQRTRRGELKKHLGFRIRIVKRIIQRLLYKSVGL